MHSFCWNLPGCPMLAQWEQFRVPVMSPSAHASLPQDANTLKMPASEAGSRLCRPHTFTPPSLLVACTLSLGLAFMSQHIFSVKFKACKDLCRTFKCFSPSENGDKSEGLVVGNGSIIKLLFLSSFLGLAVSSFYELTPSGEPRRPSRGLTVQRGGTLSALISQVHSTLCGLHSYFYFLSYPRKSLPQPVKCIVLQVKMSSPPPPSFNVYFQKDMLLMDLNKAW